MFSTISSNAIYDYIIFRMYVDVEGKLVKSNSHTHITSKKEEKKQQMSGIETTNLASAYEDLKCYVNVSFWFCA